MGPRKSSLDALPPDSRAAIRARGIQTRTLPMEPMKESDYHGREGSVPYLHSAELRALIARLRRERIRHGGPARRDHPLWRKRGESVMAKTAQTKPHLPSRGDRRRSP